MTTAAVWPETDLRSASGSVDPSPIGADFKRMPGPSQ